MAGGTLGLPAGIPSNDVLELVPTGEAGEPGYTNNPEIAGGGAQENAGTARTKPRLVVPENFVRYVNREMSRAEPHVMAQRDQMREADRFMHSHQLSEADRLALTAAKRPDTVINEIQKFIKFASGIERRTQEALIFGARTLEDEKAQIWGELCLVGETPIRAGNIKRSFERSYSGPIVDLELSNGKHLSGTPNHPVLTARGWKPLGVINEGDDLVDARILNFCRVDHYFDNAETLIKERARSLETRQAPFVFTTIPYDFHGDGIYSNVHMVRTNNAFVDSKITPPTQGIVNNLVHYAQLFAAFPIMATQVGYRKIRDRIAALEGQQLGLTSVSQDISSPLQFATNGGLSEARFGGNLISGKAGIIKAPNKTFRNLGGFATAFPILLACAAHRISSFFQSEANSRRIESGHLSDSRSRQPLLEIESGEVIRRNAGIVSCTTRVTKRTFSHRTLPVFNLETEEGFFVASDIITHNCTKTYEWFCDHSAAQYERSMAFERKLITGMAFVDIGLTRVTDPGGAPRYNLCDEFDFWWPQTSKQNLGMGTASPVRWLARESDMDVDEALRKWPDYSAFLLASSGGPPLSDQFPDFGYGAKRAIPYVVPWVMTAPLNKDGGGGDGSKPGKVKILEWQHYDDEPGYYFFDPIYHDDTWLSERDFAKYRRYLRTLQHTDIRDYDKQDHRVYKRSFLLNRKILLQEPRPLPTRDAGYTWNVMTGAWDRSDKVFYGMIRLFMPTQRYINAFFRQTLEIMGAANKGGYLMETGAVTTAQKRDIEENGARPGSINIVQAGAITAGKIKDKPVPQLPQGTMQVLAFCIDLTEKISGLSMSLIGNAPASTPGVSLRRQMTSAMLLLAAEFDALSRFRKREGELVFEYMRLLADDRIVRIGGAFDGQMVQLTKDPFAIKYDIVLDEIEQDPNLRQYYTDQIMKIAPILVRTGNFFPQLLDYVNIPAQFRQQLKQGIQQSEQQKMQMAMQGIQPGGRGKPRGIQEIQADVAVKHGRALKDVAQAQHLAAQATAVTTNSRVGTLDKAMNVLLEGRRLNQEDKKISLQALAQMFDALRPEPAPAARHS